MEVKIGRNLSALEYVRVLEGEWWICNLRRKIYPNKKDKERFGKISNFKKERLISISERNELPHIFNDNEMMKELNKRFSSNGGCPIFPDRCEDDVRNYYNCGSDVRCFYGFESSGKPIIKIGKIKSFDNENEKIEVFIENIGIENISKSCVTRIF